MIRIRFIGSLLVYTIFNDRYGVAFNHFGISHMSNIGPASYICEFTDEEKVSFLKQCRRCIKFIKQEHLNEPK